jgi:hypothetical protein
MLGKLTARFPINEASHFRRRSVRILHFRASFKKRRKQSIWKHTLKYSVRIIDEKEGAAGV